MTRLIYTSTATCPFSQDDLLELLRVSATNNVRWGITGVLLYHDGQFFQVLEGEDRAVRDTYDHIARDPRHTRANVVLMEPGDDRLFGSWSMGFLTTEALDPEDRQLFTAMLQDARSVNKLLPDQTIVRLLLKRFCLAAIV